MEITSRMTLLSTRRLRAHTSRWTEPLGACSHKHMRPPSDLLTETELDRLSDFLGSVDWPLVGRLEPSRVVLLCSGLLVILSAVAVRERWRSVDGPDAPEASTT